MFSTPCGPRPVHRAYGVVVSHPLGMPEAMGSIPSVSICSDLLVDYPYPLNSPGPLVYLSPGFMGHHSLRNPSNEPLVWLHEIL